MLDDSKYRSPYYGLWLVLTVMILIPLICYGFFIICFRTAQRGSVLLNEPAARALGFCVGTVFDLMCIICGAFKAHIEAIKKRISGFFSNLSVGIGFAIRCYFEDIKNDGVVFLIILATIVFTALIACTGLQDFLAIWNG